MRDECLFIEVPCKYEYIGCEARMLRKEMTAHEENYILHLHMTLSTVIKLEATTVRLQEKVVELQDENITVKGMQATASAEFREAKSKLRDELQATIVELQGTVAKLQNEMNISQATASAEFKEANKQLKAMIIELQGTVKRLQDENTGLQVELINLKDREANLQGKIKASQDAASAEFKEAKDKLKATIVELQDTVAKLQDENKAMKILQDTASAECKKADGELTATIQGTVANLQKENTDLKNRLSKLQDEMKTDNARLVVNMAELKHEIGNLMTFEVSEYQKKKEGNKLFISPSFYTSPNGYHMAVRVDANGGGDGKGTHVSVYAPILEGKYDAELKWPFIGKVTLTLLNQLEDNNHHIIAVPFTAEANTQAMKSPRGAGARGRKRFIPHFKLFHDPVENTQYLKDDTLYFRVLVEVADHKPWLQCTVKLPSQET